MQSQNTLKPLKLLCGSFSPVMLCPLLMVSRITVVSFSSYISYPHIIFTSTATSTINVPYVQAALADSPHGQISKIQTQLGFLLEQMHNESSESKLLIKFSDQVVCVAVSLDKLAEGLSGLHGSAPIVSSKPNRLEGKKNFPGVEGVNPSVGQACAHVASYINCFMIYKIDDMCPDGWDMVQKLMASGCDPLPRRRSLSRVPPHYSKPLPVSTSLWTQPSDANILWSHYKCKDYHCLVSKETTDQRGFFECSDFVNLSKRRWELLGNKQLLLNSPLVKF